MFAPERKNTRLNETMSIAKDGNSFQAILNEGIIDFPKTISEYNTMIESSLRESNYVYNEHVQSNLRDYTLDRLNNAAKVLEMSIDILSAFKSIIAEEVLYLKGINRKVIEIYEPLLKKLDRHKYGYQIPEYTLENLDPDDIFDRVLLLLSKNFSLELFGPNAISYDTVQNSIYRYNKNVGEYDEELKRVSLGVPNSYTISDFYDTVRPFLVKDNNLQMKRIGDDLFSDLRAATINIESIDKVIRHIEKEIFDIYSFKSTIENSGGGGNEYTDSVFANAIVIRTNLIGTCLTYIEDILKIKISIFEEMCINYRKVIIDGYEKLSADPESVEGMYLPDNDPEIVKKHAEYLSGNWIIIPK